MNPTTLPRNDGRERSVEDASALPVPRWRLRPAAPPGAIEPLVRTLGVPPLLASVLWARGLTSGDAGATLAPTLEPSAIPSLDAAAERLQRALERKESILIHGDYDADGITGTAVLVLGLRALGGRVEPFLPNRLTHGYGVHPDMVDRHAERADLFVTVDCGIGNLGEVARLRAAGVDVIVTDHHTPGRELPDALVVHPRLVPGAAPGTPEPTGAGVAYHLLWRLHERLGLDAPLAYADIATIGTIADVAPLLGENRALVREGLARIGDSAWPGVRAMIAQARLKETLTARDVAFGLAPRLNAAGRLGEPEVGLELLITGSERRARELAVYLDARNDERKRIQDAIFEEALAMVDPAAPAIVVGSDAWHPGIMGIVASKLLERFWRPVFIMARGQGSVRSTPGISAVEALDAAGEELHRYGGHLAAAGFALRPGRADAFRRRIYDYVAARPTPVPEVVADALLSSDQVEEDLWRSLCELEPFGEGHAAPRFAICETLESARAVGREGRHLQLRLQGVKGVAWQLGELAEDLRGGTAVQAIAALRENVWNERRSLEFVAEGVRTAHPLSLTPPPGTPGGGSAIAPDVAEGYADGAGAVAGAVLDAGGVVASVRRGPPPVPGEGRHVLELPLEDDPLRAHEAVAAMLREGTPLWFDLDAAAQRRVRQAALRYPTVHDVRRAFVAIRAGRSPRLAGNASDAAQRILRELDLLDPRGLARANVRRDPYESETLVAGLMQRYRLETFLNAYRHLDDEGFAHTVHALFGAD